MDKKLMGNFKRSSLIYLLLMTIGLAVMLAACEIPSPTAQDPLPVDVLDGEDASDNEENPEPAASETPESGDADEADSDEDAAPAETEGNVTAEDGDSSSDDGEMADDGEMSEDASADEPEQPEEETTNEGAAAYPDPEDGDDPTEEPAVATATESSEEVTPVPSATDDNEDGEDGEDAATATSTPTPTAAASATPTPAPATGDSGSTTGSEILHTVQPGENLYRIGLKYNISWTVLQIYNGLPNANSLQVGQVIRIPVVPDGPTTAPDSSGITPTPSTAVVHNVMPGETLFSIGLRYGFDWNQIAEANGIMNPTSLKAGQQIKIPVEVVRDANEIQHLIQTGESLFTISLEYGVPWSAIASRNNVFYPYTIYPNEGLIIPGLSSQ